MLLDFALCIRTRFIFGTGVTDKIGAEIAAMGVRSVLIHHGSGSYLRTNSLLKRIGRDIVAHGIRVTALGGVLPNPRLDTVRAGIRIAKERAVDMVLAIGGGSVIDSSKAIAAGTLYDGDVWDFFSRGVQITAAIPVAVVLTYPAAGSESGTVAVINNAETHRKLLVSAPAIRPTLAFMDPTLTFSLPRRLTAYGVTDMFSHLCERYFAPNQNIGVIDRMAEGIMKTLVEIGPNVLDAPDRYEYRAEIMWIGSIAHNDTVGIGRIQDWATHVIGNELSALYDTPHGVTLSVLMGSWMRYVYADAITRFARYAQKVFDIDGTTASPKEVALQGIEATERFFQSLGMPVSLREAKIRCDQFPEIVSRITFSGEDNAIGGLRRLKADDVRAILELAAER